METATKTIFKHAFVSDVVVRTPTVWYSETDKETEYHDIRSLIFHVKITHNGTMFTINDIQRIEDNRLHCVSFEMETQIVKQILEAGNFENIEDWTGEKIVEHNALSIIVGKIAEKMGVSRTDIQTVLTIAK
jgi:hypothetical protein